MFRSFSKKKPAQFLIHYSFKVSKDVSSPEMLSGAGTTIITNMLGEFGVKDIRWFKKETVAFVEKMNPAARKKRVAVLVHNIIKLPVK